MGTKKQQTDKSADKPTKDPDGAATTGIVVGGATKTPFKKIPGLRRLHFESDTSLYAAMAVILLIVLGLAILSYSRLTGPGTIPTPEEAIQITLKNLQDNPPANNASNKEKGDYYRRLMGSQLDVKDYKGAVGSFQKWEAADPASVKYYDYMAVAKNYHQVKQDAAALKALDKASELMPKTADEEKGYFPDLIQRHIDKLRAEYSS